MSQEPSSRYWETTRATAKPLRRPTPAAEAGSDAVLTETIERHRGGSLARLARYMPFLALAHLVGGGIISYFALTSETSFEALTLTAVTLALDAFIFVVLGWQKAGRITSATTLHFISVYALATGGVFAASVFLGVPNGNEIGSVSSILLLTNTCIVFLVLAAMPMAAVAHALGPLLSMVVLAPGPISGTVVGTSILIMGGITWLTSKNADEQARRMMAESQDHLVLRRLALDYGDTEHALLWETDRNDILTYISPGFARRLGEAEPDGRKTLGAIFGLPSVDQGPMQTAEVLIAARQPFMNAAAVARIKGDDSWWSISGRPIIDELGRFIGFRGHGSELTGELRDDAASAQRSRYDALTGLAGRSLIRSSLDTAISSREAGQTGCALFLLDLDRFKQVNDTLGHPVGDELLKLVAERLTAQIGEKGRIGRLGGDEFMVVLPGETSRATLAELARTVIQTLSKTYIVQDTTVSIGASVGIAIAPYDGDNAPDLIARADMALYAAKSDGRGVHRFYDDKLTDADTARRGIRNDLRNAIMKGGISLVYQPFVDAKTSKILGFEALARWEHPTRGTIQPGEFLPIADAAGLDKQLGETVLIQACREAVNWPSSIRLAVNVSASQVENGALVKMLEDALDVSGLAPSRMEIDISEGVFCTLTEKVERVATEIRRMGVRISMDDFGAGDTALGTLKCTAIDKIKFDPQFIAGAADVQKRDAAILRSIVNLSESLGIETLAEGVESDDDASLALLLGCKSLQGYLFGQPVQPSRIPELLEEDKKKRRADRKEARKVPRTTLFRAAMIYCEDLDYKVVVRNISAIGASIECPRIFGVDTILVLDIGVGDPVSARVAWSDSNRMGIRFVSPFDMNLIRSAGRADARP